MHLYVFNCILIFLYLNVVTRKWKATVHVLKHMHDWASKADKQR
jgi:hypothetical protein